MKKKILISTGGSGGHVVPATILYQHLKDLNEVSMTCDNRGLKFLNQKDYDLTIFNINPFKTNFLLLPLNIFKILILTIKSFIFLKKKKTEVLISTGGYMSLPFCLASRLLNIKLYLFEPNIVIGRSNKLFLRYCKKIFCYSNKIKNFPKNQKNKIEIIPPLLRKKFYELNKIKKINDQINLLVIGGSQGAKIFDTLINEILVKISNKYSIKVIHQTSEKNIFSLKNFYKENKIENKVFNFDQNLNELMRQSDLCITRAGASSLAELSLYNIPFIAIPLPTSKDNHQYENAKYYQDKDCCWIIDQNDFDKQKFEELLIKISVKKDEYFTKKNNLKELNYQNTWKNVNQKLLEIFNEY